MDGLDHEPEHLGQLGKARRVGGGSLNGQMAEHVATAGVVVVMISPRLMPVMGIRQAWRTCFRYSVFIGCRCFPNEVRRHHCQCDDRHGQDGDEFSGDAIHWRSLTKTVGLVNEMV